MDSKNKNYYKSKNQSKSDLFIKSKISPNQLKQKIENEPSIINSINEKGETLLSFSLNKNLNEVYDLILNFPLLNLNYKDKEGNSYLHLAVINQNEKVVNLLIKKGININMQNKFGNTALHLAYEYGNNLIISMLINNGINTLIRNKENKIAKEIKKKKINKKISKNKSNHFNRCDKNNFIDLKENILKPTRKYGNGNIKNINNKEKKDNINNNMIDLQLYSKYKKNYPYFQIEKNKKYNESVIDKTFNFDTNINDENNINPLFFKEYKGQKIIENGNSLIKKDNNILNNMSKETKFLTDTKEKSNNFEDTSSFVASQSSESKIISKIEKDKNNKKFNEFKSKYLIYDKKNINDKKIKENTLGKNCKSYINLNNIKSDKWKTIQDKYYPKNNKEKYTSDNILKYKMSTNQNNMLQNNKSKSKKQLFSNKNTNKTICLREIKSQNSFISKTNRKRSLLDKYLKSENESIRINHILKKRNINRTKNKDFLVLQGMNKGNNNQESQPIYIKLEKNKSISKNIINDNEDENGLTMKSSKLLKNFLSQINMEKYITIFAFNGFDDINLILEQSRNGISSIQDSELKEAGIKIPGDRAKILIRIQEISNNFTFPVPKEVYYSIENNKTIENDKNIQKIKNWLKSIKVDNYFTNFINCGYYSLELLLVQMASSNPINNEILKEELGIEKIGYRSRIINKLKEDSRRYIRELEINMLVINNEEEKKNNCQCIIY